MDPRPKAGEDGGWGGVCANSAAGRRRGRRQLGRAGFIL